MQQNAWEFVALSVLRFPAQCLRHPICLLLTLDFASGFEVSYVQDDFANV